jgi:hypothetical protein
LNESSDDTGTIQALLERLNTERLPRALALQEKVDRGERLEEFDIRFLKRVLEEAGNVRTLVAKHPEFQELVARLIGLYSEITRKGLENEQKSRE